MSTSAARNFGVQSYCFREFKENQKVAQLVREIGLNRLEICGIHADFNDVRSFEKIVAVYRAAGVEIV